MTASRHVPHTFNPTHERTPTSCAAKVTRQTPDALSADRRSRRLWLALTPLAALSCLAVSIPEASAEPGDLMIRSDDGRSALTISGDLQARFEGARDEVDGDDQVQTRSAFTVPRARLRLDGHTRREAIEFLLQVGVDRGAPALVDAALTWRGSRGEWAVDAGQLRRPLSREALTPLWRQLFVERSLLQRSLGETRGLGVVLRDDYDEGAAWSWRLGVMGGQGSEPVADDSTIRPELVARVERRFGAGAPYEDVAWSRARSSEMFLLTGLAASALLDGDGDQDAGFLVSADLLVKYAGATLDISAFIASAQDGVGTFEQRLRDVGVKASVGYLVTRKVQTVARYALVSPLQRVGRVQEVTLGANVFLLGHHLRWLSEVQGQTEDLEFGGRFGLLARTQLQVVF